MRVFLFTNSSTTFLVSCRGEHTFSQFLKVVSRVMFTPSSMSRKVLWFVKKILLILSKFL